jgi:RecA-family ATPase
LRCWYHNAEDTQREIERRVLAICQKHQIPQEELDGWFIVTTCELFDLKVANGFNELRVDDSTLAAIAQKIQDNQLDIAGFDPLINLHTTDEYNNVKMAQVLGAFRSIAQAEDCAIEVAQHTRKHPAGMGGDYTGADGRGAGSVRDAARAQRVLNIMSAAEAEKHRIAEHERRLYVRVDIDKANNAPPQEAAWLHLDNVTLPNGDEVGVMEPWQHPAGAGPDSPERRAMENQADEMFLMLLGRFTLQGRIVSDRKGRNYAPAMFANDPDAMRAKVGKAALEAAMERLFGAARIRATDSETGGKTVHRLEAA